MVNSDVSSKISDLFISKEITRFSDDIVPILMQKYQYEKMDTISYTSAYDDISKAIDIARSKGVIAKGVPCFDGDHETSSMFVRDIIYTRVYV